MNFMINGRSWRPTVVVPPGTCLDVNNCQPILLPDATPGEIRFISDTWAVVKSVGYSLDIGRGFTVGTLAFDIVNSQSMHIEVTALMYEAAYSSVGKY
jgi:hypothetical protein